MRKAENRIFLAFRKYLQNVRSLHQGDVQCLVFLLVVDDKARRTAGGQEIVICDQPRPPPPLLPSKEWGCRSIAGASLLQTPPTTTITVNIFMKTCHGSQVLFIYLALKLLKLLWEQSWNMYRKFKSLNMYHLNRI